MTHDYNTHDAARRNSIAQQLAELDENLRDMGADYTAQTFARFNGDRIANELRYSRTAGDAYVTVKVPSASEVTLTPELAQHLLDTHR